MKGINPQTFQVQIDFPQTYSVRKEENIFLGMYNVLNLRLYGDLIPLPGEPTTPHTDERAKWAVTFIPNRWFFESMKIGMISHPLRLAWEGYKFHDLDLPCVYILIKGDFIWAGDKFDEKGVLDANNIGGQVGINRTRGGVISGGKNPSGNMVQGGYFQSWFFLSQPTDKSKDLFPGLDFEKVKENFMKMVAGVRVPGININKASVEELIGLEGIDNDLAKKIVKYREKTAFKNVFDLVKVSGIGDKILEKNIGRITVSEEP